MFRQHLVMRTLFEGAATWRKSQQWGVFMRNFISCYLSDESGAAAAEYALILAIVGAGIATAAVTLGSAISGALDAASNAINGVSSNISAG